MNGRAAEDPRVAAPVQGDYFRTGAPVAFASQMRCRFLIVPFSQSRLMALLTQRGERVALLQHEAEALLRARRGELADDLAVRHLHGGDVERRRQVDDEPVDLPALQRLHGRVVRVVDERLRVGLIVLTM